jgi:hypothetical protein
MKMIKETDDEKGRLYLVVLARLVLHLTLNNGEWKTMERSFNNSKRSCRETIFYTIMKLSEDNIILSNFSIKDDML